MAQQDYWSLVGIAKTLLEVGDVSHSSVAHQFLQDAKRIEAVGRDKEDFARELYLEGMVEKRRGNSAAARVLFLNSLEIDRKASNGAHKALIK